MDEEKKVVFRLTIYEDGSFEASTEGKELRKGKFTAMDSLMGALILLMAGATVPKSRKEWAGVDWRHLKGLIQ